MDALYELMDLLPPGFSPGFTPRLNDLYLFLATNKGLEPRQAAEQYFGSSDKLKYFNKLRRELKTVLSRQLISNPSWVDNKDKALHEDCYRNFASYKILLLSNKRKTAIKIAEHLLVDLEKIGFYSMILTVIHDLLMHYSAIELSSKRIKKYNALAKSYAEIVQRESIVKCCYSKVVMHCNSKVSYTTKMVDEFIDASNQTWPLREEGLHYINRLIYLIKVFRYMVVYDYPNIIKYCDEALATFPKSHPSIRSLSFFFMYHKVPALLAIGEADKAKEVARESSNLMPIGNFNWHIILLKRIVVCLHVGDYQEAYDLYNAHVQKKCIYENITEYWNIIRGYLYFLIKCGKIDAYQKERFYLGKFMNEMPIYSKDKSGNNINILIVQILINMQRERYLLIIDKIESLRSYTRVHINNRETKRANIFINMIFKMEAASFIRIATERKTEKLRAKLKNTPLKLGQNLAIEIIPYEVLWEEMLILLGDKFRKSRREKINTQK